MKIQFELIIDNRLVALCKKIFQAKTIVFLAAVCFFSLGIFIFSGEFETAYIFQSNDRISSAEVNLNFENLAERTLGSISDVDTAGATTGKVLKFNESTSSWVLGDDDGGVAGTSPWSEGSGCIYYNLGNVGIGTSSPESILDVEGIITASAFVGDGSGLTNVPGEPAYGADTGAPDDSIYIDAAGNIGIGINDPATKLDVNGIVSAAALAGAWDTSSNRYIRIGNVQIVWGQFTSVNSGDAATTNLPNSFANTSYRVQLTVNSLDATIARFAKIVGKTTSSFQAQTYLPEGGRSANGGDYIAIGLWQ